MDDKKKNKDKVEEENVILGNEVTPESEEEIPESSSGQALKRVQDDRKEEPSEDLLQKLEELDAKYRRALADYQNLVRRTQEEKREWARFSSKELVLKLLPILDTLMLAEKHTQDKNFVLTVQQFLQTLAGEGVARIETVGKEFNPQTMEAVTTAEGESGKVLEEIRAGYAMGETILRPAQVVVGK